MPLENQLANALERKNKAESTGGNPAGLLVFILPGLQLINMLVHFSFS